jgi:hypothetical protein
LPHPTKILPRTSGSIGAKMVCTMWLSHFGCRFLNRRKWDCKLQHNAMIYSGHIWSGHSHCWCILHDKENTPIPSCTKLPSSLIANGTVSLSLTTWHFVIHLFKVF